MSQFHEVVEALSREDSLKKVLHMPKNNLPMPSVETLKEIVETIREIFFPGFFGRSELSHESIKYYIGVNIDKIKQLLFEQVRRGFCFSCTSETNCFCEKYNDISYQVTNQFIARLPELRNLMATDVEATFLGDPAAHSYDEIIFCYPGIKAITNYRIAHELVKLNVPLIPRIISEMAHSETGIDIHPEAQIGHHFAIDHGTGVVVGATCIIGNNVKLYQGVTLGAKSFPLDENGNPIKGIPRHPILEDDVVIYSGATVLGRITVGRGAVVGGNVWVTNNVAPNMKILQNKATETTFIHGAGI